MSSDPVPVRLVPFDRSRLEETAHVLALAFEHDPFTRGLVPPDRVAERLQRVFRADLRTMLPRPHAIDLAIDPESFAVLGAALWLLPGRAAPVAAALGATSALLPVLRGSGPRLPRLLRRGRAVERARPDVPHGYLATIGVAPAGARRGVGTALLRHRLALLDAAGLPAYLESSRPENDPYYARFGFLGIGVLTDPELEPITRMWRPVP